MSAPPDVPQLSTRRVVAAVVALALGGFAIGTTEFVTMGVLPEIAQGVGVDIPTAGHVISAYALGVVVGAPVLAALGARLPRRGLLVGLVVAFLVGNLGSALAPGHSHLARSQLPPTLAELAVSELEVDPPATLVCGPSVALAGRLAWFAPPGSAEPSVAATP